MVTTRTQKINLSAHEIITKKRALLKQKTKQKKKTNWFVWIFLSLFCSATCLCCQQLEKSVTAGFKET